MIPFCVADITEPILWGFITARKAAMPAVCTRSTVPSLGLITQSSALASKLRPVLLRLQGSLHLVPTGASWFYCSWYWYMPWLSQLWRHLLKLFVTLDNAFVQKSQRYERWSCWGTFFNNNNNNKNKRSIKLQEPVPLVSVHENKFFLGSYD
jgi:hypothetical protein